jgi:ClpP class serine protease
MSADSVVGSVGVMVALREPSSEGGKTVYITSTENKVGVDNDGKFTQAFRDDTKAKVMETHQVFLEHVAKYSGLSTEAVDSTKAGTFQSKEALKIGFVDKVMTRGEMTTYLTKLMK